MRDSMALRRLTAELESRWQLSVSRFDTCHRRSQYLIERMLAVQNRVELIEQRYFDGRGRYRRGAVRDAS